MKIHEYQAVDFFRKAGIPVGGGQVTTTVDEALKIANDVGYPVVLKAQVLVGGRGKAGGVKVVKSADELKDVYPQIRTLNIKGYDVERILVVKALQIKKEFYVAVTIDNIKGDVVIIASAAGGVEIEQTAKDNPELIHKYYMEGSKTLDPVRGTAFIKNIFTEPALQAEAAKILEALVKIFFEKDCSLAEINPLVIDGTGHLVAADAKMIFDDNALYRQPELVAARDMKYEEPDEIEAKEKGLSFVKLEGNVGCIVNGAGLAMGTMDAIKLSGGQPANFLDVGGSSNPEKVLNALKIILRNKGVKVILINIFGGITRCDDIANGILQAKSQIEIPVPLVVRLTGTNEKEAKEILAKAGLKTFNTMRETVQQAVAMAK